MEILTRQEEYNLILDILMHVDKKSYDPVYKNLYERIEKTSKNDDTTSDKKVFLEESEIYHFLDAIEEYIVDAESGNYSKEEKEKRIQDATDMSDLFEEETGFTI